jgi:hypothetical protein
MLLLGAGAGRHTEGSDQFAVDEDRQAALNRNYSLQPQYDQAVAATSEPLMKHFRRAFEECCRPRVLSTWHSRIEVGTVIGLTP